MKKPTNQTNTPLTIIIAASSVPTQASARPKNLSILVGFGLVFGIILVVALRPDLLELALELLKRM